jgi:signal transduction histidine kinase/PAS domain-containing protein
MNQASVISALRDPRLAAYATSLEPVWVWSNDGSRVLWANAVAVALLGSANLTVLRARRFTAHDKPAAHVIRLAASLPQNGQARLERMRGFGTGFFHLLTCTCSRLALGDGGSAILIAATEQAGPQLSLADRARRLIEGSDDAIAVFATDGTLLHATPAAAHRMAGATSLLAFEANALAAEALASGSSAGRTLVGPTSLIRAGQSGNVVLVASLGATAPDVMPEAAATAAVVPSPPVAPAAETSPEPAAAPAQEQPTVATDAAPIVPAAPDEAAPPPEPAAPAEITAAAPPAPPPPSMPASAVASAGIEEPRPHPLRFVWQMDADERFTLTSDEFIQLVGPSTARLLDKPWREINGALQLDKDGRVARAIGTRDTWSGLVLSWPVDGATQRLKIELSGLPIYDRHRNFIGYRGFGVCRDLEALTTVAQQRRAAPVPAPTPVAPSARSSAASEPRTPEPTATPEPIPQPSTRHTITFIGPAQNVVPFRVVPAEPKSAPGLNAGERNTFTEIARQLSARLKNSEQPAPAAPPTQDNTPTTALRSTPAPGIDGRAPARDPADTPVEPVKPAAGEQAKPAMREGARPVAREETPRREVTQTVKAGPAAPVELKPVVAPAPTVAQPAEPPSWLAQGSDARALLDRLPLGVLVYRIDTMLYANRTFLTCVGYDTLAAFSEAGGIDSLFIEASGGTSSESGAQTLTITTGKGDQVPVEGKLFSVPWNGENALALVLVGPKGADDEPVKPAPPPSAPPPHDDSELQARIQALSTELAAARRAAEAATAERTALLGNIGKEVRTPLTAIIGFVETMLSEKYGPLGNERYRTYLTDIHYSGARILALFDDLASLSKIDRSRADTAGPSVVLNDIVQACVAQMQGEASRVRVLIRTSLANPLPGIAAEPDSIRQVVLNLLTNSVRFAGAGGQVIVSTALGNDGRVLLRLRDTGPGLSDNDLAQLRANNKTATSADAADQQLTLAVARALLEANHASLSVTSKADEGTLVEVMFNAAR